MQKKKTIKNIKKKKWKNNKKFFLEVFFKKGKN